MLVRSASATIRLGILYLFTATVIVLSGYFQLNLWIDHPTNLLSDDPIYLWPLWFLILSASLFLVSAWLRHYHAHAAACLSGSAGVICIAYNSVNIGLAFLWLLFGFLMSVIVLLAYVIPLSLALLSLYWDWYMRPAAHKPTHNSPAPAQQYQNSRLPRMFLFLSLAGLLAILLSCFGLNWAMARPPDTQSYPMQWRDTSNNLCTHEVTLDFLIPDDVQGGYSVSTCSADLLQYLHSLGSKRVEMLIQYHEVLGFWIYRIVQIQQWRGAAKFDGLLYACTDTLEKCHIARDHSPFRRPYAIARAMQ